VKTVEQELRLKKISHDDVRVANNFPSHSSEGDIKLVPISVDLILEESIDYI
jgi:hypothetical protein